MSLESLFEALLSNVVFFFVDPGAIGDSEQLDIRTRGVSGSSMTCFTADAVIC